VTTVALPVGLDNRVPVLDVDPYNDDVLNDPFETFARIRSAGPVAYLRKYGVHVIGRHSVVMKVLKDWQTYSSTGGSGLGDIRKPGAWREPSPIVEVDPPEHTHVRQALQRIISPGVIRQWRDDFEKEADRLVGELVARGRFCGVYDLSETYVSNVFPRALGLEESPDRRENLFLLGALNFDGQGPKNRRFEETQRKAEAVQEWYLASMRREAMVPGGFGEKIFEAADRGEIEQRIAPLLVRSFLRGGLDSTTSMISAVLYFLARDPSQWDRLKSEPARIKQALDEAMRLETPIQNVCRQTTSDVEIDGIPVANDSKILVMLGAANRDPDHWDRPDSFDIGRQTMGQLALGVGVHMCIGQMIARLEGEAVLKAMLMHVKTLELTGQPTRKLNNNLRSLSSLPLEVTCA